MQHDEAAGPTGWEVPRVAVTCAGSSLAAVACVAAFATDLDGPLRTVVALGFLLFVPGLAVAELLPVEGAAQRVAIATGISLGLETLIAVTLIYAGVYSAGLALGIVVGVTFAAILAALLRAS